MNKREMMVGALEQLIEKIVWYYRHGSDAQVSVTELIDALAEEMVIECEVEHITLGTEEPYHKGTYIYWHDVDRDANPGWIKIKGHHGTPGKALAIILSLEGKDDLAS